LKEELPIIKFLPEISEQLGAARSLILQAEPGAGKSTEVPLYLIHSDWLGSKKIIMLEPRRMAARNIANYLAKRLGEKVGETVGYSVKNDKKVSEHTKLEIVTEGVLANRLQVDPELPDIGLIIFDEFHERSIHSDIALMLSLEVQQSLRDDLRLLVMSATIDTEYIAQYMNYSPVIKCPGRSYPVEISYKRAGYDLKKSVCDALNDAISKDRGDILIFLPGQAEIRKCREYAENNLGQTKDLVFLSLYGALPIDMQEQVLSSDSARRQKVIFSTNVAETSLTIEGVSCVIDSGLEKVLMYDPTSGMNRLDTCWISKASATQRAGRAGRLQQGQCIRLWTERDNQKLQDFKDEEIKRVDLAPTVLETLLWGYKNYADIKWLTAPPKHHFEISLALLSTLGLVDKLNKPTKLGQRASKLNLHPRLAAMLLTIQEPELVTLGSELASIISERDLFYSSDSVDITQRLSALQEYKVNKSGALHSYPIKRQTVEAIIKESKRLKRMLGVFTREIEFSLEQLNRNVGILLLSAYPERLAKKRSSGSSGYLLANGRGVLLTEHDPLNNFDWIVVCDCDAQKKEGRVYSAGPIDLASIVSNKKQLIYKNEYKLDNNKTKVVGREVVSYGAITVYEKPIANIQKSQLQDCLASLLKVEGLSLLNWTEKCESWIQRVKWLSEKINFPSLSKESLLDSLDNWLLPYINHINSLQALRNLDVYPMLTAILSYEEQKILNLEAPTHYITPSEKSIKIRYEQHQDPTVSVLLQEVFGELKSPMIAKSTVRLRFELLSPAKRPIQITSDLANFWKTSYFDVAKDMRSKYPKHRWPEEPLKAKAGRSIKLKVN
jgi:ATP-dependent helicase HrpB